MCLVMWCIIESISGMRPLMISFGRASCKGEDRAYFKVEIIFVYFTGPWDLFILKHQHNLTTEAETVCIVLA